MANAATRGRSGTIVGLSAGTRCYIPDTTRMWLPVTVEYVNPQQQTVKFVVDDEAVAGDDSDDDQGDAEREDEQHRRQHRRRRRRSIDMTLTADQHFPLQNARALTPGGYEDMIDLNHLHEAAILYNLKRRFHARLPYTYTGEICLAVNPYQWIEELYADNLHARYLAAPTRKNLPPHVYAVSVAAFKHMRSERQNQSILVSGESGAGKTETTKILMDNLAQIATPAHGSAGAEQTTIQRILDVNPLLESFGNAKTKRNDNSSRFGKFTQLQFHRRRRGNSVVLAGARCETYLLEKTRVVTQETGERNYHIFYQLFHGSTNAERNAWGFSGLSIQDFAYVADDDAHLRDKDCRNYLKTKHALTLLGLGPQQQDALFQVLAGILHLGQTTFCVREDNDDASCVDVGTGDSATELFGLSIADLEKALCSRTMRAGGEVYAVPLSVAQAASCRDALAKAVYANVFDWMVTCINNSLSATPSADEGQTIGVLDIFGFESFVHNSFEQLCINYANEKLQQKFTEDVFKAVQDEYAQEAITWDHISYADNQDVLAMIEGKLGVISLLNEETVRPKGNDEGFVGKLSTAFRPQRKIIEFPRTSRTKFVIHHYAASVTYEATGFLEKHKDALLPDLAGLMRGSRLPLVVELFKAPEEDAAASTPPSGRPARRVGGGAGGDSRQTVGTKFKVSLNRLMDNINQTNVHYIRCIKPNSNKSSIEIDERMVVNQLRCAGVIEAICIARAGYPNRMKHDEFVDAFDLFLTTNDRQTGSSSLSLCTAIAKHFSLSVPEEYQLGKTKIYLQQGILERLETAKAEKLFASVSRIQSCWRGLVARRLYRKLYAALVVIQRRTLVFVYVCRLARTKVAIGTLQRVWRGHVGRCEGRARRRERTARFVQRVWRGHRGRRLAHERRCSLLATQIQCAWRSHTARAKLFKLVEEHKRELARRAAIEAERQRRLEQEETARRQRELAAERKRREEQEERERRELENRRRLQKEAEMAAAAKAAAEKRAQEGAAVGRAARGGIARQRFAKLTLEDEVLQRRKLEDIPKGETSLPELSVVRASVVQDKDTEDFRRVKEENARLQRQLEELVEANIELETLITEWQCEQDVLKASNNVRETDLKHQLQQQRQRLETARGEQTTLEAYISQQGIASQPPIGQRQPEDSEDSSDDDDDQRRSKHHDFVSPFIDDRQSSNVSSFLQRPTFSNRLQTRREESARMLRAGAKQIGRAKEWMNKHGSKRDKDRRTESRVSNEDDNADIEDSSAPRKPSGSTRLPLRFKWKG